MTVAYKPLITIKSYTLTEFQQKHALAITILSFAVVITVLVVASMAGIKSSEMIVLAFFSIFTTIGVG